MNGAINRRPSLDFMMSSESVPKADHHQVNYRRNIDASNILNIPTVNINYHPRPPPPQPDHRPPPRPRTSMLESTTLTHAHSEISNDKRIGSSSGRRRPLSSRPTTSSSSSRAPGLGSSTISQKNNTCTLSKGSIQVIVSPLSLDKVKSLANNCSDLTLVTSMQFSIDLRSSSFNGFSQWLPSLSKLKIGPNSYIPSIRDFGTGYNNLTVLSMSRCNLLDLDGITVLSELREFYAPFNRITSLSNIWQLEKIEIIDVEGNLIDSLDDIEFLAFASTLTSLSILGNPIASRCIKAAKEILSNNLLSISFPASALYRNLIFHLVGPDHLKELDESDQSESDVVVSPEELSMLKEWIQKNKDCESSTVNETSSESDSRKLKGLDVWLHGSPSYALWTALKSRSSVK